MTYRSLFALSLAVLLSVPTFALARMPVRPVAIRSARAMVRVANRPSPRSLREAARNRMSVSSARFVPPRVSSSSSSAPRGSTYDTMQDRNVQSNILLLDQTSPILAGARFFSNNEPIQVTSVIINLVSAANSVDAMLIYDADGRYLGAASQQGGAASFKLNLPIGVLDLGQRVDHSIYVRGRLKAHDRGGQSGEDVQISSIELNGNGVWSNESYAVGSGDTFNASQTARGAITRIGNAGNTNDLLVSGPGQLLAEFRFDTQVTDSQARVRITGLLLQADATGGTTVSNVTLRQEGTDGTVQCSVSSSLITCNSIPSAFGTITGSEVFRVYGDVTIPVGASNPSLRLTLNNPGTVSAAGDISWTDGETTFTWLPVDTPVVRGTQFQ